MLSRSLLAVLATALLFLAATVNAACSTQTFDYIIVGSNAGSVVARALSERKPTATILILEHGALLNTSNSYIPNLPRGAPEYTFGSAFGQFPDSVKATTTPQAGALLGSVKIHYGNVTGGGSQVNSMYFVDQSAPYDLASWPAGLRYADLIPAYKWVEAYQGSSTNINTTVRGTAGVLKISDASFLFDDAISPAFFQACVANGIYNNPDFSSNGLGGCGYLDRTIYKGKRINSWDWFIRQANNPKITTWQYADVTDIDWVLTGFLGLGPKKAESVSYKRRDTGETCTVSANKEIILSAGALGTPKILLKSGLWWLPGIGKNLRDDVGTPLVYNLSSIIKNPVLNTTVIYSDLPKYVNALNQGVNPPRTNVWSYGVANSAAFIKSDPAKDSDPNVHPDIQAYLGLSAPLDQVPGGYPNIVAFPILLINATSTGSVTLDIFGNLQVDPNYLPILDDTDLNALYKGLLRMRKIATSAPLSQYISAEIAPGIFVNSRKRDAEKVASKIGKAIDLALETARKRDSNPEETDTIVKRALKSSIEDYRLDVIQEAREGAMRFYQAKQIQQDLPEAEAVMGQQIPELERFVNEAFNDLASQADSERSKGKRDVSVWNVVNLDWTVFLGLIKEVALKLYIRYTVLSGEHYCCTSKMSDNTNDIYRVVDTQGLVVGFSNLRVIDMSSIPSLPHTNPTRRLFAFSKRMADFIQ